MVAISCVWLLSTLKWSKCPPNINRNLYVKIGQE